MNRRRVAAVLAVLSLPLFPHFRSFVIDLAELDDQVFVYPPHRVTLEDPPEGVVVAVPSDVPTSGRPATVAAGWHVARPAGAASTTGILTDQSGAALPGATVVATNQATNVEYTAVSNETGAYTITSVPIGTYVVKAELASFKSATTRPIQLEARQILRLDFKLKLGGVQETIEVSGETQVLQTESATVGEVISGTTLSALPLNGRNSGQLSLLLPGVVTPNPSTFTGARNTGGGGRPYVNGNREQANNYTIDGVDMNETIDNLVAYQPSPDALAEISVEANNYSAETGNVIKSGTNRFSGNVFEFYRDSKMDANSWANNRSNAAKPERRQDVLGGTFGGPIVRNKPFFFADYQGTRFGAPGSGTISVASEAWRQYSVGHGWHTLNASSSVVLDFRAVTGGTKQITLADTQGGPRGQDPTLLYFNMPGSVTIHSSGGPAALHPTTGAELVARMKEISFARIVFATYLLTELILLAIWIFAVCAIQLLADAAIKRLPATVWAETDPEIRLLLRLARWVSWITYVTFTAKEWLDQVGIACD